MGIGHIVRERLHLSSQRRSRRERHCFATTLKVLQHQESRKLKPQLDYLQICFENRIEGGEYSWHPLKL
tara:strand:- start:9334 stop:9540 length:207 start_codon:yes stop_codon:yes gene_type:complete